MKNSKMYGGIMGLIVGDALGVPYEFKQRDTFTASGMAGYGTHNQPPGTWSDDSSMTIATIDALIDCDYRRNLGETILQEIMMNFVNWLQLGHFTPYYECFDIGNTTKRAIQKYESGTFNIYSCGCNKDTDNGNGSLMRILPLVFVSADDNTIDAVSALTHSHPISKYACEVYVCLATFLYSGWSIEHAYNDCVTFMKQGLFNYHLGEEFMNFLNIPKLKRNDIKSTGYVVDTLIAAVWCLMHTDNYKDCVLTAVNLGGDTDTIAAVAGGLAGITYGAESIPEEWVNKIARKDEITELIKDFSKVI